MAFESNNHHLLSLGRNLVDAGVQSFQEIRMCDQKKLHIKIIVDFILLLTVGFPILIFHLIGVPTRRGFFCDDDSIRYPFKDSTVSNQVLYIVGIFLPVIVICVNEYYAEVLSKCRKRPLKPYTVLGKPIPALLWKMYEEVGVFLFGACLSQMMTDIGKYTCGRLRPHFIDVCHPNISCSAQKDQHSYVLNYECQNTDLDRVREARLSFPSGHSSFSAYTMIYLVLYLQGRMCVRGNWLLKPFLQFIFVMMTWSCALSRVSDYKHHWSDVLSGLLLGTTVAIIVARCISDIFSKKPPLKEEDNSSHGTAGITPAPNYNTIDLEQQ